MKLPSWLTRRRQSQDANGPVDPRAAPDGAVSDLSCLYPLIVPAEFYEHGDWPGPIHQLAAPGFALTWGLCKPDNMLFYVSRKDQAGWEAEGIAWKDVAMANLRAHHATERHGVLDRPDGSIAMAVFLEAYGLGPARLLLPGALDHHFPDGYRVAIPEMTCGLAFTTTPSEEERYKIEGMIDGCFQNGTSPLSDRFLDPASLWSMDDRDLGAP